MNPEQPKTLEQLLATANEAFSKGAWQLAEHYYCLVLQKSPAYYPALFNFALLFKKQENLPQSLVFFEQAHLSKPKAFEPLVQLAELSILQNKTEQAIDFYKKAIVLKTDWAVLHQNIATLLHGEKRFKEAIFHYQQALALGVEHPTTVQIALANCYYAERAFSQAFDLFKPLFSAGETHPAAMTQYLHAGMFLAEWEALKGFPEQLLANVLQTEAAIPPSPFSFLSLPIDISEKEQRVIAERYAASFNVPKERRFQPQINRGHSRLKIGYASSDFHAHATAHLMLGLFKRHDRAQFEIHLYSWGPNDGSVYRQRIESECDVFHEMQDATAQDIASQIFRDEIDILIDLKGHTQEAKQGIFALRPAPLQLTYLGYPGSFGAHYIDYVITDRVVTPPYAQEDYTEKLAYLPNCYQVNDSEQPIDPLIPSRAALGLPETGFVFCCFCSHYKIEPTIFAVWMRILKAVPDSVLWLIAGHSRAEANFKKWAEQSGLDASRLIFAPTLAKSAHLARLMQADLFLDTYFYNGHTTASDALWAGVPVLTVLGKTFASRVSASLLNTMNLQELIQENWLDYQEKAIAIAHTPSELKRLKEKVWRQRIGSPLFNTDQFTRDLETLYHFLWKNHDFSV